MRSFCGIGFCGIASLLAALTACTSGGKGTDDSGPDDSGPDDSGPGGGGLTVLTSPCGAQTVYALLFRGDGEGWVGCGVDEGLHHTTDGGDTLTDLGLASELDIFDLSFEPDGSVLACGAGVVAGERTFLWRDSGGGFEPVLQKSSSSWSADCGQVAAAGDGTMIVASNTGNQLNVSDDDGASWSGYVDYWEDDVLDGTNNAFQLPTLRAVGGAYYGAGDISSDNPYFYRPSPKAGAAFYNLEAVTITTSLRSWVKGLDTPDGGTTWVAGGRDEDASSMASGYLFRSEDGGDTWIPLELGEEIDIIEDLRFSEDGLHGVAVGHRYPPASLGGFVLLTYDGGLSWEELAVEGKLGLMESAWVSGTTWWAGGDGVLVRGSF